jgi:hypothetical protein
VIAAVQAGQMPMLAGLVVGGVHEQAFAVVAVPGTGDAPVVEFIDG